MKHVWTFLGLIILVFASLVPFYTPNDFLWTVAAVGFFFLAHYITRFAGLGGLVSLGLHRHKGWLYNLTTGLCIGASYSIILFILFIFTGAFTVKGFIPLTDIFLFVFLTGFSTMFIAFAEELIIRGYLYQALIRRFSMPIVIVASSLIFSAFHFPKWGMPLPFWIGWAITGLYLLIPVIITRSLWFSIGIHWTLNFVAFGLISSDGIFEKTYPEIGNPALDWIHVGLNILMVPLCLVLSRYMYINNRME